MKKHEQVESQKSHKGEKKNKLFVGLFVETFDSVRCTFPLVSSNSPVAVRKAYIPAASKTEFLSRKKVATECRSPLVYI